MTQIPFSLKFPFYLHSSALKEVGARDSDCSRVTQEFKFILELPSLLSTVYPILAL